MRTTSNSMSTLTPPTTLTAARQLRVLRRPSVPGFNFDFYLDRHTGFAFVPNCLFGGQQHSFPGNLKGFCGLVTALLSRSSLRGHVGKNMSTASGSVLFQLNTVVFALAFHQFLPLFHIVMYKLQAKVQVTSAESKSFVCWN